MPDGIGYLYLDKEDKNNVLVSLQPQYGNRRVYNISFDLIDQTINCLIEGAKIYVSEGSTM
jgi:hypothetical protein